MGVKIFYVQDFDMLVDSLVEVGIYWDYVFEIQGKEYYFVVWGESNLNGEQLVRDMEKIIVVEVGLFGNLFYDYYWFIFYIFNQGYGGLEYKDFCVLNYDCFGF